VVSISKVSNTWWSTPESDFCGNRVAGGSSELQLKRVRSPEGVLRQYFAALRPATREGFRFVRIESVAQGNVKPIAARKREAGETSGATDDSVIKQYPSTTS